VLCYFLALWDSIALVCFCKKLCCCVLCTSFFLCLNLPFPFPPSVSFSNPLSSATPVSLSLPRLRATAKPIIVLIYAFMHLRINYILHKAVFLCRSTNQQGIECSRCFGFYSHFNLMRQSLSVVQSTYIFMYPHMHCCLLCCVGAWFVKLFYLLGLQHFYVLCKHTLRQERRVLCVCVCVCVCMCVCWKATHW
jgi:hypothetical protein